MTTFTSAFTGSQIDARLTVAATALQPAALTPVNDAIALKANQATTNTKAEDAAALLLKANQATTYTKAEDDASFLLKANQATTYTITQTDAAIAAASSAVQAVTASGTILAWGTLVTISSVSATTQTLPDAVSTKVGKTITLKNLSAGIATIAVFAGNTVSGAMPTLGAGDSMVLQVSAIGIIQVVSFRLGTAVSPDMLSPWVASTSVLQYSERSIVIGGSTVAMLASVAGTTAATFTLVEASNWGYTAQNTVNAFPVSTVVLQGLQIVANGQTYQAITNRVTGAIFDETEQTQWMALSSSATGTRVSLSNFAANGSIGTALTTVDGSTVLAFTQTTAGINVTLPSPTSVAVHKTITLENVAASTAALSITLASGTLALGVGQNIQIQWNGTAWASMHAAQTLLPAWSALAVVPVTKMVTVAMGVATVTLKNNTLHTTNSAFDATEVAQWSLVSQSNTGAFPASTVVVTGFRITDSGQLYESIASRFTGTIFNTVEKANWTQITVGPNPATVNLLNQATSTTIGTVASTVDIASILTFTQTTAGVILVLPTPTSTSTHKSITLENLSTSTASLSFNMGALFTLTPGMSQVVQWNGTLWAAMGIANLIPEFGSFVYAGANVTPGAGNNTAANAIDFVSFVLPSAGTWEVSYAVRAQTSGASGTISSAIFTSANALIADTETIAVYLVGTNGGATSNGLARITTTAAATFKVRVWNAGSNANAYVISDPAGKSSVAWKKISGNLPVSGQSVDTLYVTRSASHQTIASGTWANKDVIFNGISSGNIPYNATTGVATLTAGKTYNIRAGLNWAAGALFAIKWELVDAVSNVAIGAQVEQIQPTQGTANSSFGVLDYTYTPVTNQTVKIRMASSCNMLTGEYLRYDQNTYMSITQVGSTSYSGTTIIGTPTLGQVLTAQADGTTAVWATPTTPTITSVALSYVKHTVGQTVALNQPLLFDTVLGGSMTRPNSSTWLLLAGVTYHLEGSPGAAVGTGTINFQWRDTTNSVFIGNAATRIPPNSGNAHSIDSGNATAVFTPVTNTLVQLWATLGTGTLWGQGASDSANSFSWAQITQIGANAYSGVSIVGAGTFGQTLSMQADGASAVWSTPGTATTTSVDNLHAAIGTSAPAAGNALSLSLVSGNIGLVANAITLQAGKTYHLEAGITRTNGSGGSSEFTYMWRNLTNSVYLGAEGCITQNTALGAGGTASALVTPTTPITVALWCVKNINVPSIGPNNSGSGATDAGYAIVTQLGSTAYSGININGTPTTGQFPIANTGGTSATWTSLTGGVTNAGGVMTVVTNANLTGAVTSLGNATTLPVASASSDTVASAAVTTTAAAISGMSLTTTGVYSALARANLQVLLRPAEMVTQAGTDLTALVSAVSSITTPALSTPATISAVTLAPGVYNFGASAIVLGNGITLNGTATDFWIFKTTGALSSTASASVITMTGGATAANVFWLIGNNAPSLGASTTFKGTILNTAAIALPASINYEGRMFTTAGAISVGAAAVLSVPTGTCTVVPMGVLSTFLSFTSAGANSTTSTTVAYGDVGSKDTAVSTWAANNLSGMSYAPGTLASRAVYSLFVGGVLVPFSARTVDSNRSTQVPVALESVLSSTASGQVIECRQQVLVGSAISSSKILTVMRLN